jgi:signal peptidase
MIARPGWFDNLFAALLMTLLAAAWVVFAPVRFGGQAAYVIVSGTSMEPNFHRGDLAILRQETNYAVGDVVTYRHPTIGPVIHRIIALDGERFVFKGDNNSWIDEYRPLQNELIGKLWIYLPSAGTVIEQLRVPRNMAALVAVMGVMVMTTGTESVGRRQRRGSQRPALFNVRLVVGGAIPARQRQPRAAGGPATNRDDLFFVLATIAFTALLLGVFAFTRSTSRTSLENIDYTHAGTWSYSAAAPAGLYDNGAATTGAPVFRRLSNNITIHFAYGLTSTQPADLRGTYRLVAEIGDVSGWRRTIELQPATAFSGSSFGTDATLDLNSAQSLIDTIEQQTGAQRSQYTLAILSEVRVQGLLAGQALTDEFTPRLEFQIDRQELRFQKDSSGQSGLQPTKQGLIKHEQVEPNRILLLGLALDVLRARQIALVTLALALSAAALLAQRARGAGQSAEVARIQRKYGPLLISIRGSCTETSGPVIDVATIDDLARLAERGGHMILHQIDCPTACYIVQEAGMTYRYQMLEADAASIEASI